MIPLLSIFGIFCSSLALLPLFVALRLTMQRHRKFFRRKDYFDNSINIIITYLYRQQPQFHQFPVPMTVTVGFHNHKPNNKNKYNNNNFNSINIDPIEIHPFFSIFRIATYVKDFITFSIYNYYSSCKMNSLNLCKFLSLPFS